MPLESNLFKGDQKLEAAAVSDPAHIVQGAHGEHVRKIQMALIALDGAAITADGSYGPATAKAVYEFKKKRDIVNRAYQSTPDSIVGKMTMAALDREMAEREKQSETRDVCALGPDSHKGIGATETPAPAGSLQLSFAITADSGGGRPNDEDDLRIQLAFLDSRQTLREAIAKLNKLRQAITRSKLPFGKPLSDEDQKVLDIAVRWLNLKPSDTVTTLIHLASAVSLMEQNIRIRNSKGQDPETHKSPDRARLHAEVDGNTDHGIILGGLFLGQDGRNCRRDVITHEFFHFLGVKHGGGSLGGPTIREAITTPSQSLNSADNLAQLVAELTTPSGKTDACARPGE